MPWRPIILKRKSMMINRIANSRLWGDKDETINHMISGFSKQAPKEYKTRYDKVEKIIHWYMHKPESVQENTTYKILWDFEIQIYHLTPARRPDLVIINKREPAELTLPSWRTTKWKSKKTKTETSTWTLPEN